MSAAARALVSVVVPCFNQERYLPAAIESVRRQTYTRTELIVVDDGSTDATFRVATDLGARVMRQENRGVSEARNQGLAVARGEFVVMLDGDDELLPDAIARGVAALESRPDASAIVGQCVAIDAQGNELPSHRPIVDSNQLYIQWLSMNFVWTPSAAMFRRRALEGCGGFPHALGPAADYAVYLQLARTGTVLYRSEAVARYRQHDASMSRDFVMMLRSTLAVLRRERQLAPEFFHAEIARGRRAWCTWFGELMIDDLRASWQARTLRAQHLRFGLALMYYCPARVAREAARKLACLVNHRRSRDRTDASTRAGRGSGR